MGSASRLTIGAFVGLFVGLFWAFLFTSELSWFLAVVLGSVLFCGFMTMRYEEWFLKLLSFFT
jgi:hypothetical protein